MIRLITLFLLFLKIAFPQNCVAPDGTEGVELWSECYSIENTTEILLSPYTMFGSTGNILTGEIPPEIGNLENLTMLNLSFNQLSGEIPPEIGNLQNLNMLFLRENQLTGEIPSEIGNLENLTNLDLSSNQLSGEIPIEIDSLLNLTDLNIGDNNLQGELRETLCNINAYLNGNNFCPPYPACFDYNNIFPQNCENLICDDSSVGLWGWCFNIDSTTGLNAQYSNLSGNIPPEIGELVNLETLNLSNNNLGGEIPSEIFILENLSNLNLNNNLLNGEIPLDFWSSSTITSANLSYNELSGQIPIDLCTTFSNPENIILKGNQFCLEYPSCLNENNMFPQNCETTICNEGFVGLWGGCFDIETTTEIQIYDNGLNAPIPSEIGSLVNLNSLSFFTETNGNIPPEIGNLTNLNSLILNCNLSGGIPSEIGNLTNLNRLDLYGNQLTNNIPSNIGELQNLDYLALNDNQLNGQLPPQIGNLINLEYLNLSNNYLNGEIPSELGDILNLKDLFLQQNELNGEIPNELSLLDSLYSLNLSRNQLTGEIPATFGSFAYLSELQLSFNELNGSIPSELGLLENLRLLFLNNNQLSGEIPTELGSLTNLRGPYGHHGTAAGPGLDLSYNQLTGSFPSEIANLENLFGVYVNDNDLSGEIPQEICGLGDGWGYSYHLRFGNNNFCPSYPECLTEEQLGLQDTENCEELFLSDLSLPKKYELHDAYPNPFNPKTTIKFQIPQSQLVCINIFDIQGKIVTTLINNTFTTGNHTVIWNGKNNFGEYVAAGMYFYHLTSGKFSQTKKMLLLK